MKSWVLVAVAVLVASAASAQAQGPAHRIFTRQAIATAVAQTGTTATASPDPRHDWSRLPQLAGREIVLRAQGHSARTCELVAVNADELEIADVDRPDRTTRRIVRADVDEVSQWVGRRGSPLGAVIGAAAGFVAGFYLLEWATVDGRNLGGSGFLVPVGIAVAPLAGGVLGYRAAGDRGTLTTIYVRP